MVSFFEKLQNSMNHLSDAKKNVAYYLMDQWLEAAFTPASQVAKKAKVSESVVVRFSQDLGYSGFPDLQKDLQEILKSRLVSTRLEDKVDQVHEEQDVHPDLYKVYQQSVNNLEEVFTKNSMEMFNNMLDNIIGAKRIVILARKNSLGPAHILNLHINELYSKSQVLNGENVETLDIIRGLSKEDLVIFITIPSYSRRMMKYSDYLVEKNIPQAAITNSPSNAFGRNAKSILLTSVNSLSFSNSHLATIFIIDSLFYLLTLQKKPELLKFIEDMKMLNERFGITYE